MTAARPQESPARPLAAYVPRLLIDWLANRPGDNLHTVDGSMAFVDISGFTKLTERLARKGRVGAEEMSDILDATFGALLTVAQFDGADLVKWGGDAVLLLFDGADHAARAARSAFRMRRTLRTLNQLPTSSGRVSLKMSVGIHSGEFHFFLVGDPQIHRELIVSGPTASMTAEMESVADAGQIAVSDATAAYLPPQLLGDAVPGGRLLRSEPKLTDLPATAAPVPPAHVDVSQVVPSQIRRHLLAASGESEHRPIAVAFVQFSGTDALLRDAGPAALADALDECVRNVQHATAANDVTFFESDINRDGGKIMLTAGAPRSAGNDEERMLRAARMIADGAGALALRVGVNCGHVFAGDFGPDFRRTYSVKGDAINLAARVMGKAHAGQVLATRAVVARSPTVFHTDALEPFLVKGKALPVNAVSVGRVTGARAGGRADGPFVGRENELALLEDALSRADARSATFVDIVGEPGIGKSRLVQEVRARATGLVVLNGPSGAYESTTAYFPFRAILREALTVGPDADDDLVAARLTDRVKDNAPDLVRWLPLLAIPLGVEMAETSETRELDEMFRKGKLEQVTIEALRLLLPTPSLLVFEDAHLMDDASADLLRRLEEESVGQPWVVLVTRREQASGFAPTGTASAYSRLQLSAIDAPAALELLLSATQSTPLTREAMQAIADRAGGNPLFLGSLALIAGRSGSVSDLPDSVEGVVTSQIDRLDPHDRTLLRYAAVLGMRFPESALRDMLAGSAHLVDDGTLNRLSDFLDRDGDSGLRFRHALVRDVAYAGLPYRLRREMHGRVGRALEDSLDTPETEAELLSLHFFHAGRYDAAWRYSRIAGERAQSRYAYTEAAEFLERALESAKRTSDVSPAEAAVVHETLGDVWTLAGRSRQAIESYRRARRYLAGDPVAGGALMFKEACIDQRLGKFAQSLRLLRRGLHLLADTEGKRAAAVRAQLATRYGFGRYLQGRIREAIVWCETGAREAERAGDRATLAMSYNALHGAFMHSGREEDAPYGALAMRAYEELGDLAGQGHCANNLAIGAHQAGRWVEAEQMFGRAAAIFTRIGDIANECNAVYNKADLLVRQGRFDEAEPLLRDVLRTARAVDDRELIALALRESARAYAGQLRFEQAHASFEEARARFTELGLGHELLTLDAAVAEARLRSGRPDNALALVDAVLKDTGAGATDLLPMLRRLRASALIDLVRAEDAAVEVALGMDTRNGTDGGYERAMLLRAQSRVAALQGRAEGGELEREAARILDALGVVSAAEALPAGRLELSDA
jgi:class 3 adenylate cyclase/tetratricopeptide (TPR) repeat protein